MTRVTKAGYTQGVLWDPRPSQGRRRQLPRSAISFGFRSSMEAT